jgi:hypothetical protein
MRGNTTPLPRRDMPADLRALDSASRLMDSVFRIPGTRIRFGLDPLLGLIPGLGEGLSAAISGGLAIAMLRHGANGPLVLRMVGNIALDSLVGSVPLLGDLFDVAFKANRRNLRLLIRFHEQGGSRGPVWPWLLLATALLLGLILLVVWGVWKGLSALLHAL